MGVEGILIALLREAWGALALGLVLMAMLGLLARILQTAGSLALGGSPGVAAGLAGGLSIFVITLYGLVGVPEIARAARTAMAAAAPACGPFADMAAAAATLVGVIGALRMLKAVAEALAAAAVGGAASLAGALLATAETVFGMAMTAMAIPLITRFLGGC